MKSIYESASSILEQNKLQRDGRSLPPLEGAGSGGGGGSTPSSGGYASVPRPSFNIRTKVMKEPDIPKDKLPSNVETPAVFKTNPQRVAAQKAKDLNDKMDQMQQQALNNKMDQMQQQGIGQTKPKVSQDHYKNLKALKDMGIKQANESRMSSAYSTIRRILGEKAPVQYSDAELKAMQDKRAADLQKDRNIESDLSKSRGSQTKYIQDKAQKGNAEMKAAEKKAAEKKKVVVKNPKPDQKPVAAANTASQSLKTGETPVANKVYTVTPPKIDNKISALSTGVLGREANVANVTLDTAKKDAISKSPNGVPDIEVVKSTNDIASAPSAIEKPEDIKTSTPRFKDPTDPINPMPGIFHPKFHGDKRQVRAEPIGVDPVSGSPLDNKPGISSVTNKKTKGVLGMKESNINKKFNVSDALYQSVMEVMKNGKKEGSVPRTPEEEKLAAFHGDPKRITHGDVLKARGVTKEEAEQVDEALEEFPSSKHGNFSVNSKVSSTKQGFHKGQYVGMDTLVHKGTIQHKENSKPSKFEVHNHVNRGLTFQTDHSDEEKHAIKQHLIKNKMASKHTDITEDVGQVDEMSSKMKMKLGLYGKKKKTNEESVEEGIMDKVLPILTGGSDKDLLKKLQKDMGVPQTGQKPAAPVPAKPVKENKDTPGNGYAHQCAVHVKSESFGEGRTITTQHADPDDNGNIEWYDVMFEHGIERYVPTSSLEILVSEMHGHSKKKKM